MKIQSWMRCAWLAAVLWCGVGLPQAEAGLPKLGWFLDKPKKIWLQLGVEAFARPEWQNNRGDFNGATEDSDFYVASRIRLLVAMAYDGRIGASLQLQDSGNWGQGLTQGGKVRFSPDTSEQFTREVFFGVQLFEARFFLRWPEVRLRFDVGRMRIFYGDAFFIGDPAFIPPGQSFDAMRLRWKPTDELRIDLLWMLIRESLAASPTQKPNCQGSCFWEGDYMAGTYVQWRPQPAHTTEAYAFFYERAPRIDALREPTRLVMSGLYYKLRLAQFWMHAEAQLQVGRHLARDLLAAAGIVRGRYTLPVPLQPFVGFQFMLATGDSDPADNSDNGFLALFLHRRLFYGLVNLWGLSNIIQPMVRLGFHPHATVMIAVDGRYSWKFDPKGALVGGASHGAFLFDLTGADGNEVGAELNLRVQYSPMPGFTFDLGGGMFLPAKELHNRDAQGNLLKTWGTDPSFMVFLWLRMKWR